MEHIQAELINFAIVILTALVGFATQKASAYLKQKGVFVQLENNKELVKIVVSAIEQMAHELDGREKFSLVKAEVVDLLHAKHVKITEKEINFLIESAVKEMKKNVHAVIQAPEKK